MSTESERKLRVLVIDDEEQVGRVLVRLLRYTHEAHAVTDADTALELARQGDWDAIVCDVMMPGTNGPAFLARLEAECPEVVPRVGFMTGGLFNPEVRAFLESRGDEGWLSKPFQRQTVLDFIERLVRNAERDRPGS